MIFASRHGGATNPPPPEVTMTAITPGTGPMAGGIGVAITDAYFTNVTSVTVGGSELGGRTRAPRIAGDST